MTLVDLVLHVLESLRLIPPSDERQIKGLAQRRATYAARKFENDHQLERLQQQIRRAMRRAKEFERQFGESHGEERRIIQQRIEQEFAELDTQEDEELIYHGNVRALSQVMAKVDRLIAGIRAALSSEEIADLNLDLQQAEDELKERDVELARGRVRRKSTRTARQHRTVERATAIGADTETQPIGKADTEVSEREMPVAMRKRLAQLEAEE